MKLSQVNVRIAIGFSKQTNKKNPVEYKMKMVSYKAVSKVTSFRSKRR